MTRHIPGRCFDDNTGACNTFDQRAWQRRRSGDIGCRLRIQRGGSLKEYEIFIFCCDFLLLTDVNEWINNECGECVFLT